jgi:serine/threonine protein kinase
MGEVYRATDVNLKRSVAIKVLPTSVVTNSERLTRFQREAEVLAALNHQNIAQIYGLEKVDTITALVLELIEGPTLADRIAQKPIPIDDALSIAMQIAQALEAAHEQGIIHRDLKPANIKVRPDGMVKVLDFGVAKVMETSASSPDPSQSPTITTPTMTQAGMILGTAAYMSPEQARGRTVDKRADIWAFGCVFYEMLTGKPAFAGETITDILSAIVKSDPDWGALPGVTPSVIRRLLKRCLDKDPNQRLHAIADARLDIAEAKSEPITVVSSVNGWARRERAIAVVAAAALVAALTMTVPTIRYFRTPLTVQADAPELRLQVITPPTTDPVSMALSPDGRRLTFVATSDGTPRLWLRPLDSVTGQPLPGTDGASYPFWSPDSQSIGFFAEGKLKRIDIGGGPPQPLADAPSARGGTWSRDGVILFGATGGILRVPASRGEVVRVTRVVPSHTAHRFPQFLPDGRRFLYFSQGSGDGQGVFLGSLDSPETTRLTAADTAAAFMPPDFVLFMRQGSLMARRLDATGRGELVGNALTVADPVGWDGAIGIGAFSVSATGVIVHRPHGPGRRQLTWFDSTGKPAGVVGVPDADSLQYPELSRDSGRVAIDRTVLNNRDVFLADVVRGLPGRFTFDAGNDAMPIWSPDGGRIVFRSNRKGAFDLYEKSSSRGGNETLLYESPENKIPNTWSPDGKSLLFTKLDPKTGYDVWVLPLESKSSGDRQPYSFVDTPFDDSQAAFSPNGQWVAYQSNEGGPLEIYVQPFPGPGAKQQISNGGGSSPRWRRDGKELFYLTPDAKLMAVPIGGQSSTMVEAGPPVALFQTRMSGLGGVAGNVRPQYDVAGDGRFLMNITTEETISPITVILNWKPPDDR